MFNNHSIISIPLIIQSLIALFLMNENYYLRIDIGKTKQTSI